jgi:4-carboxymuconolactone decarboxylase
VAEETERERGDRMWREVMHFDAPTADDPFTHWTRDVIFGEVWASDGLGRRDRRLTSLTCAAIVGASGALTTHMQAAVDSGDITLEELGHWVLHLAFYAGWPVASGAYIAWRTLAAQQAAS